MTSLHKGESSKKSPLLRCFQAKLDPSQTTMLIDRRFHAIWENHFNDRYFNLRDPEQNIHCVGTIRNRDGDYVFYVGVQYIIEFYHLEGIHTVHFTYAGDKFFDIKILNIHDKEINYPKNGGWDNFVPRDFDHIEVIEQVEEGWTVRVTKAIENGSNPLPIPAKIVREVLKENQQLVYIFDKDENVFIVDLRRGRRI
ncbi:hypothetical protein SESBI_26274 [Sesbania bispinosa]|nr:hypothetical protein SESBI_26274 [Sesbania bispinosa]